ncbi:MAG: ORF6C domain-containing protein [Cetobacterium sp.]
MEVKIIEKVNILGKVLEIYGSKEKPLFLAKSIADWIGHTNVSEMVRNLDDGTEKVLSNVDTLGGNQVAIFVTEYGVYEILFTSRKRIAKEIRASLKAFLRAWRKQEVKVVDNNYDEAKNILLATRNLLELSSQHQQRINELENKIENQITIETYQRGMIQKAISKRVYARYSDLGERIEKRMLYSNLHKDLRYKFSVGSYGDLKKKDYEMALNWINTWLENSNLRG